MPPVRARDRHLGVGQTRVDRPGAVHPGRRRHPVDPQLHVDPARVRVVQVAPPRTPDARLVGPPRAVTGQGELDGLGEAGLAGFVTADDQREARTGVDLEGPLRADAAKAGDGHRLQPDVLRRVAAGGGAGVEPDRSAGERGVQLLLAGERGEDQLGGLGRYVSGGQPLEDQLDHRWGGAARQRRRAGAGLAGDRHGQLQTRGRGGVAGDGHPARCAAERVKRGAKVLIRDLWS